MWATKNSQTCKRKILANTKLGKRMLHFSIYFTPQLLCTDKASFQVTMTMLQIRTFLLERGAYGTLAKKKA